MNAIHVALLLGFALFTAQNDWPQWRGLNNDGMARGDAPHEWNDTKNVAWRVAIPGRGNSSPTIWKDRIFLTTAREDGRRVVLGFNREDGKLLWEAPFTGSPSWSAGWRAFDPFPS